MLLVLAFLIAGPVSAQRISEAAARQIKSLMDEKASRTPAQKKINSQILYALKMDRGQRITPDVASLRTNVVKDAQGRIKVDMRAVLTARLLNELRSLGCEIIFSSERFSGIVANIPLDKVEQIAALNDVQHIDVWSAPMNNNGFFDPEKDKRVNNRPVTIPDFSTGAPNIREKISKALNSIKKPTAPFFAGSVTSEADVTHKANIARSVFGVNGAGIKIGVLSDGVSGYATSQASGNLPPVITILAGQAGSGSEGRAMLELIHDLAPGAELYFATAFTSQASFAQNILNLRAAGCDIIVDDVTYFREGVFQDDDVARAVNTVTASGAMYFTSAGNSGNKNDNTSGVWEGDFVNGGASIAPIPLTGDLHIFSGATVFNTLTTAGRVTLKWSDPLLQSGNDYDLFVTNSAGTTVVFAAATVQDGNDNPFEDAGNCFAGERLFILKKTGAAPRALHLNTNRGTLTFNTTSVMYGHNAAANAFTVAATPAATAFTGGSAGPFPGVFSSANSVERFSSDGPRRMFFNPDGTEITPGNILFTTNGGIVLQKPNFTAADGTLTSTPGFAPFFGTSAAAPHAAAIAALIKSGVPGITNAQINNALESTAIDIEAPGHDRDAGAGIIMAYEAMVAAGATTVYSIINVGAVNTIEGSFSNTNGAIEPGETASMTIALTNLSPNIGATNVHAVLTSSTAGVSVLKAVDYGNIAASATVTNTATPFIIGIASSVPCGSNLSFTLTVTYEGGETAETTFTLPLVKIGNTLPAITGVLGSAPPSGGSFVSGSGLQTNRLNRNSIIATCAAPKGTPALQEVAATQKAYHSYTFTNSLATSQCVTVSVSSSAATNIYSVVYGNGGYNPTSIQTNYLADPGSSTNATPFSFTAPAGQQFTVVVHEVTTNGGIGTSYNLNVGLGLPCTPAPACTPVVISPLALPGATSGSPYSQLISATGGSGYYNFSSTGTLPAGVSFSNNSFTGTPTELGSFPITVSATDITGCPAGTANYTLVVPPPPDAATTTALQSGNNPSCDGTNVTFTATVTSGGNPVTTGTVTFTEGATVLASNVALNGSGTATFNTSALGAGSHNILATYNAATGYLTSNGSVVQEVNAATTISVDPVDKTIYALNNTTFSITASATAPITYKWHESTDGGTTFNPLTDGGVYSGTSSSTLTLTAVPFTMNGNKYRCYVTGGCGNATSAAATLTVNKRPTIITYTGDNNEQYSDRQTLTAVLKDQLTDAVLSSKTVTFTIGIQSVSDGPGAPGNGTDANGLASETLTLHQDIGPYNVVSSFAGDDTYASSSDSDPFRIIKENAIADYTGPEFVSVPCATCATAKVMLSASIRDTTAVYPLNDTRPGDIRKSRVRFVDLNTNTPISGWLTPGLVNSADSTRGVVNYEWTVSLPNSGYNVYSIGVIVDSIPYTLTGNYTGRTQTVLSISRSSLNEFITGGGNIIPTSSNGQYASDAGLKMNFGYNVKYNKANTKLQGSMNLIFRRGDKVYQIKSTSITSLSVNSTNPCSRKASFTSKANLQDVTDINALPQPVLGNLTLNVTMTDNGTPGVNNDKIGVTLWNGNNLVYSSNWITTQTIELLLNGGNLEVHNGVICPANTKTASPLITAAKEGNPAVTAFAVKAYPNPLRLYTTISYELPAATQVSLAVYDNLGRKLAQLTQGRMSAGRHQVLFDASKLAAGVYTFSLQAEDAQGKAVVFTGKLIVAK